ncbi:META domain-containing protein [Photobacterium sanctipauli]|uniref:META domain-containing protein n=1 Tax=Photobacterium sanctipauli TaxID=1342794 RepID=A0A2T3NNY5_9GAMM|nr:META domain-containing protein [Photobacterium sanctipauli]PSW17693.1 META domain-containing protein [Photobacterium sanctipauli]
MKKRYLAALALPVILAACASNDEATVKTMTTEADIATHNWVLTKVDNKAIDLPEPFKAPNLQLNTELSANGHSGCNRYFGQAELKDGKLRIEKMGMTMMACPEPAMEMERLMSATLMDWSTADVVGNQLTLTGAEHSLTFTRGAAE